MESSKKLNFFPARHGLSKCYSPKMTLHKEHIYCDAYFTLKQGEQAQRKNEPDRINKNTPRALDYLRLRPLSNKQKGHDLLHSQTNKIVNCKKA